MNEHILAVKSIACEQAALDGKADDLAYIVQQGGFYFCPRDRLDDIETPDFSFRQVVVYAVIRNAEGKILCYERDGDETRLHGLLSVGVSGHVNTVDLFNVQRKGKVGVDFDRTVENAIERELDEEIGAKFYVMDHRYALKNKTFLGVINSSENDVDRCHLGLIYIIDIDWDLKPQDEIKNPEWLSFSELAWKYDQLESWSKFTMIRLWDKDETGTVPKLLTDE